MSLINQVKQKIKEDTAELPAPEYVELMRELAMWAEYSANLAEYVQNFNLDDE